MADDAATGAVPVPTVAPEHLSVLVVCTANICRSPAAAILLDAATDDSVSVTSAGTAAQVGHRVAPRMAELLDEAGVQHGKHLARQVDAALLASSDLILTASRNHRAEVLGLNPAAVRRTFTLGELARLLRRGRAQLPAFDEGTPDAVQLAALAAWASAHRSVAVGDEDDIPDPWGRSGRTYRTTLDRITRAVVGITDPLL